MIANNALVLGDRAGGGDPVGDRGVDELTLRVVAARRTPANGAFQALLADLEIALGLKHVQHGFEILVGLPLQHRHQPFAVGGGLFGIRSEAPGGFHSLAVVVPVGRPTAPGIELLLACPLIGKLGVAQRDTQLSVRKLVHIGQRHTLSLALARAGADTRLLLAVVDRSRSLGEVERTHRAKVNGGGQALIHQTPIGRLVNHHRSQQLRRELVEFDPAAVAVGSLLATVQRAGVEVWRHAANTDALRPAAGLVSLGSHARQARNGLRHAGIGQLADVLRADGLDDVVSVLLHADGALDGTADARDGHGLGLGLSLCAQHQHGACHGGQGASLSLERRGLHGLSPGWDRHGKRAVARSRARHSRTHDLYQN